MKTKCVRNSFALITLAALISVAPTGAQTITSQTQDSDTTRRQLAEFDRFLDAHPEVREEIKENPNAFMNREQRYERHDADSDRRDNDNDRNRDRDTTRGELASF